MRIAILVILLLCGIGNIMDNGSEFALKNSSSYSISYNESLDEYYIYSNDSLIDLKLYVSSFVEEIHVDTYDYYDSFVSSYDYEVNDSLSLVNESNCHYVLSVTGGKSNESIKVYTFWGEQ